MTNEECEELRWLEQEELTEALLERWPKLKGHAEISVRQMATLLRLSRTDAGAFCRLLEEFDGVARRGDV